MDLQKKPFYLSENQLQWVSETLASLSVKEKVGQLFCIMGQDYAADERISLVREYGIGGILFRPMPAKEVRDAYEPLDKAAKAPLLKAANLEEGGSGGITDGTFFGWPMTVAATDDVSVMEKFAAVCAKEGQMAGINWTFSPVCDLDLNFRNPITNVRTCGSDLARVKEFCSRYVRTLQGMGMAACAKHFPGDGVDFRDQHLHPSYNSLSSSDWYASYGAVYQQLIEDGLMSIMVGHIVQPAVTMEMNPKLSFEDCNPASLCKELVTGVLREKFGFNGVITTDATIMAGFTQSMPRKAAIPAAIMAGCDMLVFSTDIYEDISYMMEALENGTLTAERLDEAVMRILALKVKVAGGKPVSSPFPEAKAWREECADKCVTLVKNKQDVLPITPERFPLIRIITLGNDDIADGSMTEIFERLLHAKGFQTERFNIETEDIHGTKALTEKRLTIYLANCEQASNQTTVRLFWAKKHALDVPRHPWEEPSVFISFANPYHLQDVPRVKTYINAYSCHGAMIEAVVSKITGESTFKGKSPVDPFCGLPDARIR